jgi:hypothetical protein
MLLVQKYEDYISCIAAKLAADLKIHINMEF